MEVKWVSACTGQCKPKRCKAIRPDMRRGTEETGFTLFYVASQMGLISELNAKVW